MNKQPVYYLICTTPRSGSSHLSDLMYYAGLSGRDNMENLHKSFTERMTLQDGAVAEQIKKIFDASSNPQGIGGFKIMHGQFEFLYHEIIKLNSYRHWQISDMAKLFPPQTKYIFLHRRDKVRQAISVLKMTQGLISNLDSNNDPGQNLHFNLAQIELYRRRLKQGEKAWQKFFQAAKIEPHEIFYEEYTADLKKTLMALFHYLGVALPDPLIVQSRFSRLSNATTEDWLRRYYQAGLIGRNASLAMQVAILPILYKLSYYLRRFLPFYTVTLDYIKKKTGTQAKPKVGFKW